jgi:hypothetical protein
MAEGSSRGLMVSILLVGLLNLIATGIQITLTVKPGLIPFVPVPPAPEPTRTAASDTQVLPKRYTAAALAQIADRATKAYNLHDPEAFYAIFDDIAKNQIPRDRFEKQLGELVNLAGTVDSAAYLESQRLPPQGNLEEYQLNYAVKLSGATLQTGIMLIRVVDRDAGPGIVGFFINGRAQ